MKQLADLDFLQASKILNALIDPVSSDPGSPVESQLWYNTTSGRFKGYDGTTVFTLVRLDGTDTYTGLLTYNPASGNVPFAVHSSKTDTVTNLNADRVDGYHAAESATVSTLAARDSSGNLTVATPTSDGHAATKAYVDSIAAGQDWKESCLVATTANITLSGEQTIDGVAVTDGDRVLVKDQSTGAQNGIYVCSTGSWSRSSDADADAEVTTGLTTFVESGTDNAGAGYTLTTTGAIVVGTTALTFTRTSGGSVYVAGNGIVKSGTTFHFGQSASYTTGALPYASGSSTIGFLAAVASGKVLKSNGTGTAPLWAAVDLTADVTGTLPTGKGGTGTATQFTEGSVVLAGASGVYTQDNAGISFDVATDRLTVGLLTIANLPGSGTTNDVLVKETGGVTKTRTIDSRVWGSSLVGGSGTANYLSKWTGGNTLATAAITDDGSEIAIITRHLKIQTTRQHIIGGFGANTGSTAQDWDDSINARSGNGNTLLNNATNGPVSGQYHHPFSFEYNAKDGSGNMTQFAIPYRHNDTFYGFRCRNSAAWSSWISIWTSSNDGAGSGLDSDLLDGQEGSYYTTAQNIGGLSANRFALSDGSGNFTSSGSFIYSGSRIGFGGAVSSIAGLRVWTVDDAVDSNSTTYEIAITADSTTCYDIATGITDSGFRAGFLADGYANDADFQGILAAQYGALIRHGHGASSAGGTITNSYGIYIDTYEAGSATLTNIWGLYQASANAKNYLGGSLTLNTLATSASSVAAIVHESGLLKQRNLDSSAFDGDASTLGGQAGSYYLDLANSTGDTDDVTEGAVNFYYTDARARAAISSTASAQIAYNSSTGAIGLGTEAGRVKSGTIGDGSSTSIAFTHSLGTRAVIVEVFTTASPYDTVACEVKRNSTSQVTLEFNTAPSSGEYTVVVAAANG